MIASPRNAHAADREQREQRRQPDDRDIGERGGGNRRQREAAGAHHPRGHRGDHQHLVGPDLQVEQRVGIAPHQRHDPRLDRGALERAHRGGLPPRPAARAAPAAQAEQHQHRAHRRPDCEPDGIGAPVEHHAQHDDVEHHAHHHQRRQPVHAAHLLGAQPREEILADPGRQAERAEGFEIAVQPGEQRGAIRGGPFPPMVRQGAHHPRQRRLTFR